MNRVLLLQHNRTSVLRAILTLKGNCFCRAFCCPKQEADPDLQSFPSSEWGGRLRGLSTLSIFGLSADLCSYP